MNSKNVKTIRSQVRNVVKEEIAEVLTTELVAEVEAKLRAVFGARLEAINESIMSQLKQMDERSKDLQQFMLNQVQAELGRSAPPVHVDQTLPESASLQASAQEAEAVQPQS